MDRAREPLPTRISDTPPLPETFEAVLDAGLDELGVRVDPTVRAAIAGHVRLLLAWTGSINLTAIRDPVEVARGHVLDSLAALPLLRAMGIARFVDLGSGGGYPGLPLAAALPADRTLLVEPIGKKARFLETAVAAVGLAAKIEVASVRVEALAADPEHRGRWPAVTARAVASLAELVELAFPLLAPGGVLVAWKRGSIDDEVEAAGRALRALGGGALEVHPAGVATLAGHVLVAARRRGRVPDAYPRDPARRKRHPW